MALMDWAMSWPVTVMSPLMKTWPSGERVIRPARRLRDELARGWMKRVSEIEEMELVRRVSWTMRFLVVMRALLAERVVVSRGSLS